MADEPTGNLDTRSGEDVMKILHELNEEGRTIVLITHDNDIARQATRAIRIIDGKVVSDTLAKRTAEARCIKAPWRRKKPRPVLSGTDGVFWFDRQFFTVL